MKHWLIGRGRLLQGVDEAWAIEELKRLTGKSEQDIRDKLLSGKRMALKSSTDKARIDALYAAYRAAGLDVKQQSREEPATETDAVAVPVVATPARGARALRYWVWGIPLGLLVALILAGGYVWYLAQATFAAPAQAAEAALADGRLVAVGHAHVGKLMALNRLFLGKLDAAALPVSSDNKDVVDALLDGPAHLAQRLEHLFVSVHAPKAGERVVSSLLLLGSFDRDAVLAAFQRHYRLGASGDGVWHELQAKVSGGGASCTVPASQGGPSKAYLLVDPKWILLTSDRTYGGQVLARLQAGAAAAQDLARWQGYRTDRLASLMVMSPEAGKALDGMQGMLAQQAASRNTQVSGVAVGAGVDLLARGLQLNLSVHSGDAAWRQDNAAKLRKSLDELKTDSRQVSPTLGSLVSRIKVSNQADALALDVVLDKAVLQNVGQVVQEVLGSVLGMAMPAPPNAGVAQERLQSTPADYSKGAAFATLPALELKPYEHPLFKQGAFTVDMERAQPNAEGLFELQLLGKVALPKVSGFSAGGRKEVLSLSVDAVTDANGANLLRDERCLDSSKFSGRSRNHEPQTSAQLFGDVGQITKTVRLAPGARVEAIHRIKGRMSFTPPVLVRQLKLPLQAGASVEHAGLRLYLARVGDGSVSYQVSGERERLLEVRALNSQGKALQEEWRMDSDGRVLQNYAGKVQALEVYVAEQVAQHSVEFQLENILAAPTADDKSVKPVPVLTRIDPNAWAAYARLDMSRLEVDASQWYISGKNRKPLASKHWPGVSMYVTHTPEKWGNSPHVHVYYPMLSQLPSLLSALSYQIDEPAAKDAPAIHYTQIHYPYNAQTGEVLVRHRLAGLPVALTSMPLHTGLKQDERLGLLKGKLIFRLPTRTASTTLALQDLWQGKAVSGVTLTLTEMGRGMFPGYGLKVEGDLTRLVNLYGVDAKGQRVQATPVNYQQGGYWTLTLPFGKGVESVELILAQEQKILEYPFALRLQYP